MGMTKKDFEFIARTLLALAPALHEAARLQVIWKFADELALANPKFDRLRFVKACGVAV